MSGDSGSILSLSVPRSSVDSDRDLRAGVLEPELVFVVALSLADSFLKESWCFCLTDLNSSIGKSAIPIERLAIVPNKAEAPPEIGSHAPSSVSYSRGRYLTISVKLCSRWWADLQLQIGKIKEASSSEDVGSQSAKSSLCTFDAPDRDSTWRESASEVIDVQIIMESLTADFATILFLNLQSIFFRSFQSLRFQSLSESCSQFVGR